MGFKYFNNYAERKHAENEPWSEPLVQKFADFSKGTQTVLNTAKITTRSLNELYAGI